MSKEASGTMRFKVNRRCQIISVDSTLGIALVDAKI